MDKHFSILAVLHIAYACLMLFAAAIVLTASIGGGELAEDFARNVDVGGLTRGAGVAVSGLIAMLSIPSLAGGIGMMTGKAWARTLLMIGAAVALFSFPLGTALGAYTFWAVLQTESGAMLRS
jgi:hypothetical protein